MINQVLKVDLRDKHFDLKPHNIITKDTLSILINAVVFYRVIDPVKSVIKARDFIKLTTERAKSDLREIVGEKNLEEVLEQREKIAQKLQESLDKATDEWGIKVISVKITDLNIPKEMERAMASEAEAMRERKARIIKADAEVRAAEKMESAAKKIAKNPSIIELRKLQTMSEIGAEKNSTIIMMMPEGVQKMFRKR